MDNQRVAFKPATSISVVMPVYNQAGYLPQALESVFAQTYPRFELIVVDDGSTDATPAILAEYQRRYTFTVIHQTNQRLPAALNAGFARASGEYLTWTSSDNLMLPEMLSRLAAALDEDSSVGLVYADHYLMEENDNDLGVFTVPEYDRFLILHVNLVRCCFLYRRACMELVGLYDPRFVYGEDWEYWTRIAQYFAMKRIPLPLYRYRLHSHSMTSDLVRGQAQTLGYQAISTAVKRRSPWRWWVGKVKLRLIKSFDRWHPVVKDAGAWRLASVQAAQSHVLSRNQPT
jgi:glycosyltransferase involved in cell wall biosynthesis